MFLEILGMYILILLYNSIYVQGDMYVQIYIVLGGGGGVVFLFNFFCSIYFFFKFVYKK